MPAHGGIIGVGKLKLSKVQDTKDNSLLLDKYMGLVQDTKVRSGNFGYFNFYTIKVDNNDMQNKDFRIIVSFLNLGLKRLTKLWRKIRS